MGWIVGSAGDSGVAGGLIVAYLAFVVLTVAGMWKTFTKAGEAGWQAIIPIYNVIVLLRIVGRPWWWLLLLLIPCVNIVMWIIIANDLSQNFGKGIGFTFGLILLSPIFIMILGFGNAQYVGAGGTQGRTIAAPPPPPPPSSPPPPPPPPAPAG